MKKQTFFLVAVLSIAMLYSGFSFSQNIKQEKPDTVAPQYIDTGNPVLDKENFEKSRQEQPPVSEQAGINAELILGVPKICEKTLSIIIDAIKIIKGAEYVLFCPKHNLILIKYNPELFSSREAVVKAIERQNASMPMFIKEGTFALVMEMCHQ